jgi:hypothetical protein
MRERYLTSINMIAYSRDGGDRYKKPSAARKSC